MPKATLTINDTFTFCFSKNTVGYEDSIREIPIFVHDQFIKSVESSAKLLDENLSISQGLDAGIELSLLPNYLLEVSFEFGGVKIGGISYAPKYKKESKVAVSFVEHVKEDSENVYYNLKVNGLLIWDYKTTDLAKHKNKVEQCGSSWDNAKISLRINFRQNFNVLNYYIYNTEGNKVGQAPFETVNGKIIGYPEDVSNFAFVLAMTPNIFSVSKNEEISIEKHEKYPHIYSIADKKIVLDAKDLKIG